MVDQQPFVFHDNSPAPERAVLALRVQSAKATGQDADKAERVLTHAVQSNVHQCPVIRVTWAERA